MRIINYLAIFMLFASFAISNMSCGYITKEDVEPVSELSTQPIFLLEGGEIMTWEFGKVWEEPGFSCSEIEAGGTDLNHTVKVDTTGFNVNKTGLYTLSYTGINSYGSKKTAYRNVLVSTGVGELFDISGEYFSGFNIQTAQYFMTVTPDKIKGFWRVTRLTTTEKVESVIADLGDKTYIVAKSVYTRKISNLRYVAKVGTAQYKESTTPDQLVFSLTDIYEDNGSFLAAPPVYKNTIWKRIQ